MRISAALVLSLVSLVAASPSADIHVPPVFTLSDLVSGRRSSDLKSVLTTTGLLQVSPDRASSGGEALQSLCRCSNVLSSVPGTDRVVLADDATIRTTLGTATIGSQPVPISSDFARVCGSDAAQALEAMRDYVAEAANAFQVAWDLLLSESTSTASVVSPSIMRTTSGRNYQSIQEISLAANHLEHFHVYSKNDLNNLSEQDHTVEQERRLALDWHTDAGLFLAFVPAHDCDTETHHAGDRSFYIMEQHQEKVVAFDPTAVTIMLGTGAEHWLDTNMPLRATRHAIHMRPGQSRAWYGMSKSI